MHELKLILDRPIAFHRCFVELTGSVEAALMLSQAVYWANRSTDKDNAFWKTAREWQDETGLSVDAQATARRKLRQTGFWLEERRGVPATLYYKIDFDRLAQALNELAAPTQQSQQIGSENAEPDSETPLVNGEKVAPSLELLDIGSWKHAPNGHNSPKTARNTTKKRQIPRKSESRFRESPNLDSEKVRDYNNKVFTETTTETTTENILSPGTAADVPGDPIHEQVKIVINELNTLARFDKRPFRSDSKQAGFIAARLKDGATLEECCLVVRDRVKRWLHDPKMREYLTPETLFCKKNFEKYVVLAKRDQHHPQPKAPPTAPRNENLRILERYLNRGNATNSEPVAMLALGRAKTREDGEHDSA